LQNKTYYYAVHKIAWAYILIAFDVNIGTVNILPNWLAFIMIYNVLDTVAQQEQSASLLKPLAAILTATSAVDWVLKLFGISFDYYVYALLCTVLSMYFDFQLITNIYDIRCRLGCTTGKNLKKIRTAIAVNETIVFICLQFRVFYNMIFALAFINAAVVVWLAFALFSHSNELEKIQQSSTAAHTVNGKEI